MQKFINPEELNTLLDTEKGPILLIFLDKKNAFFNQQQTLKELYDTFGEKLRIILLDIEYQNIVTEKFKVYGSPAFIFCKQGKRKDVLLGKPDPGVLQEFIVKNF